MSADERIQPTDQQVQVILHDVLTLYGYDFTSYAPASLRRRLIRLAAMDGFTDFDQFHSHLRNDKNYFSRFLEQITVNATEMFRDVEFYRILREEVVPQMQSLSEIRVWHAGCSTGEEVYSMAILLQEAGLLERARLLATDINPSVLDYVRTGIFPVSNVEEYNRNYIASGGKEDFARYYKAHQNSARMHEELRRNIVVEQHNLTSDHQQGIFHLIMCRNVLIYFDKRLQDRILKSFLNCLEPKAFLALGSKETLQFSSVEKEFRQVAKGEKIYRVRSPRSRDFSLPA